MRVLEDVARFILDDSQLTARLKALRHSLRQLTSSVETLSARRVGEDVGASTSETSLRRDLTSVLRANARRAQEGLRVLEELSRGTVHRAPTDDSVHRAPTGLDAAWLKEARFALYGIEQELTSRLLRRDRAARVRGLYVIIDPSFCRGRGELDVARAAIAGGASVVQLRDKQRSQGEILPLAVDLKALCQENNVLLIINDHPDLTLAAGADGVHLGQKDLPVAVARRILPIDALVGRSTALFEEALEAVREGADYIAVGSIFPTSSKEDTRPAGLETLRKVREAVTAPLVAIGGINRDNVAQVLEAGADAVAVISAAVCVDDVEAAARDLVSRIERAHGNRPFPRPPAGEETPTALKSDSRRPRGVADFPLPPRERTKVRGLDG
ncbi:MAG: thiamine phosphate synthase [Chloroflexi bacterium]|nr:thiamine phosphate synthase [Chloroflexota bacterium]